jgi:hypothetical protein
MHPSQRSQLPFQVYQLGGKYEVVVLYRKDVILQIKD